MICLCVLKTTKSVIIQKVKNIYSKIIWGNTLFKVHWNLAIATVQYPWQKQKFSLFT